MDSDLSDAQVVARDTFTNNNNVKVVFSKTSDGGDDLEEGELSEDGSPGEVSHRVVSRPDMLKDVSTSRVKVEVDKRNPWGEVSEGWAADALRSREYLEMELEEPPLKISKKSVKDRLGWKRREEPGLEPDWNVKMKRPRMEMVADLEERKGSVRNRLHGANLAKRNFRDDRDQQRNSLDRMKGPVGKSYVFQRGKEALDKKIVRSVLNDVETSNRDDLVDFPSLSGRFMGSLERRPRCREAIKRTVEFGHFSESDSKERKENVAINVRKESVDSLENDNGSDLDDDSSMLIQVIQSDFESSDDENKKIREAVKKMEEVKKREEMKRKKLKLIKEEESAKSLGKLEEKKCSKNSKDLENQKLKDEEKIRALKITKEMRVREKIKALDSTEKKLLMEKSRQERLRRKMKAKKSAKESKDKSRNRKHGRKVETEQSESTGTETDSSSSSSSDSSDDSSDDSSGHEDVKKRKKFSSREKHRRMQEKHVAKGKTGWRMWASSTPKKEASKVQKVKDSSEEYKGKDSDIKRRLKEYLKKAKEKKMK